MATYPFLKVVSHYPTVSAGRIAFLMLAFGSFFFTSSCLGRFYHRVSLSHVFQRTWCVPWFSYHFWWFLPVFHDSIPHFGPHEFLQVTNLAHHVGTSKNRIIPHIQNPKCWFQACSNYPIFGKNHRTPMEKPIENRGFDASSSPPHSSKSLASASARQRSWCCRCSSLGDTGAKRRWSLKPWGPTLW